MAGVGPVPAVLFLVGRDAFRPGLGEVSLKVSKDDVKRVEPNTVTVMLVEEISEKSVGVVLLDATSGAELARLDRIEVAIAL